MNQHHPDSNQVPDNSKEFDEDEFKRILKTGDKSTENNKFAEGDEPTENNEFAENDELAENDDPSENNYSNEEYKFSKNMLNL